MLSRALILATVAFLMGGLAGAPAPVRAQNLEAGKSPSQIFAGSCTACHKSARGLLKTVAPGSLPGFLRQHYTTSPEMAGLLSSFLISNGAADRRYGGGQSKAGKAASPSEQPDRQGRRLRGAASQDGTEPPQAAKPEAEGSEPSRRARNARRLARPSDETAKPADGEAAAPALRERDANSRKSARQRLSRRKGKPAIDAPSNESSKQGDPAKEGAGLPGEPSKDGKPAAEAARPETTKSDAPKSEPVRSEAPTPAGTGQNVRADPAPAGNLAPATPPGAAASSVTEPSGGPSTTSAVPTASQPAPTAGADSTPPPASPAPSTPK
jgi:hypothetical protein